MREVLEVDCFAPDAELVRHTVVNGGFETKQGPDGAMYTGISEHPVTHWPLIIEKWLGKKIVPRLSCFRLNLAGELPHSWVHSDLICAQYASVLYLNTPQQCYEHPSGTAFWKHNQLKVDRLATKEELESAGINWQEYYSRIEKDWKILELWERVSFVPMEWNKFVTYPTALFHSRFPFDAFGSSPKDGRLIWICFYDLEVE